MATNKVEESQQSAVADRIISRDGSTNVMVVDVGQSYVVVGDLEIQSTCVLDIRDTGVVEII